jgi:Flp pilus assembly protein TadG
MAIMSLHRLTRRGANLLQRLRPQRGQVIAMTAVAAVGLIGMGSFVVDLGAAYRSQRKAQSAADGSALAAAQMLPTSTSQATSASNAVKTKNLPEGTVTLQFATTYVANDTAVVKASTTSPAFLSKVLGFSIFNEAVTRAGRRGCLPG